MLLEADGDAEKANTLSSLLVGPMLEYLIQCWGHASQEGEVTWECTCTDVLSSQLDTVGIKRLLEAITRWIARAEALPAGSTKLQENLTSVKTTRIELAGVLSDG